MDTELIPKQGMDSSSNVDDPPGSSPYCYASSSGRINSHFKYCFVNLGAFTVNSQIFEH